MARPGPDDPDAWPEADQVGAHYFDPPTDLWDGWVVLGKMPPEPFLSTRLPPGRTWPRAVYGPPGTKWVFTLADVVERASGINPTVPAAVLKRLLRKFVRGGASGELLVYEIPESPNPLGVPVDFVRTQIIQAVGPNEQAVHVLQWMPIGSDAPAMDTAALKAFGDRVRDSFKTFLSAPTPNGGGGNGTYRQMMATEATYIDVHTSLVHQAAPDGIQRQVGQTAISPFGADSNSLSDSGSLPYEVALCLSLNTNFRGTRFRGRCYLGPLANRIMGSAGLFNPTVVNGIGARFGEMIDRVNQAGDLKLSVISQKFATAAPVQGVRVGQVPDSQRRRRRGQQENFVQTWGTPIGGAV